MSGKQPARVIQCRSSPQHCRPTSHLANEYALQQQSMSTSTSTSMTEEPTPKFGVCTDTVPRHLCSVKAGSTDARARTVNVPRIRTAQLCSCKPIHTPAVPRSVHMIWCYRRLGMRTSPFRMQIPILLGTGASFFLQLLLPPWLMRGCASKPQPQRRPTRRDLLYGPGAQGALSQRPRAHHAPTGLYTALHAPAHGNDRHQPLRLYGYNSSKACLWLRQGQYEPVGKVVHQEKSPITASRGFC